MAALWRSGEFSKLKLKMSFFKTRTLTSGAKNHHIDDLQDTCKNIERFFNDEAVDILKNDSSSTVVKILCGTKKFVIRRDNFRNIFKFIKRVFSKSRSRKLWEKGRRLKKYGFKTLEPLILIEDSIFYVRLRSYIIYELLEGVTFKECFSNPELSRSEKERIAAKLVDAIESWHSVGVTHGDPKAGNVLVNAGEIYFIDIEDIRWPQNRWARRHAVARDMGIVLHNLQSDFHLREVYCRRFALDYPYGMRYFGRWLIEKFWKSEYEVLRKTFSGQNGVQTLLNNLINGKNLKDWTCIKKPGKLTFASYSSGFSFCLISSRAFVCLKGLKAYFKKPRIPHRGIFSMIVSLGICSFRLPNIVDAGVSQGKEYVLFEEPRAETFLGILQKSRLDANTRIKLIHALAQEIGRLHATGFSGVIVGVGNIFVERNDDVWDIGFVPSNSIAFQSMFCRTRQKKELKNIIDGLFCELSSTEVSDFVLEYNRVLKRA